MLSIGYWKKIEASSSIAKKRPRLVQQMVFGALGINYPGPACLH